jgi:hypothetical protein
MNAMRIFILTLGFTVAAHLSVSVCGTLAQAQTDKQSRTHETFNVDVLSVRTSPVYSGAYRVATAVDMEVRAKGKIYSLKCEGNLFHRSCGTFDVDDGYTGWMEGERMVISGKTNHGKGKESTASYEIVGTRRAD